jgi:hypothetical protein
LQSANMLYALDLIQNNTLSNMGGKNLEKNINYRSIGANRL